MMMPAMVGVMTGGGGHRCWRYWSSMMNSTPPSCAATKAAARHAMPAQQLNNDRIAIVNGLS